MDLQVIKYCLLNTLMCMHKHAIHIHTIFCLFFIPGYLYENSTGDMRFTFTGLSPYTRYTLGVRAKAAGEVGPSAQVNVITPAEGEGNSCLFVFRWISRLQLIITFIIMIHSFFDYSNWIISSNKDKKKRVKQQIFTFEKQEPEIVFRNLLEKRLKSIIQIVADYFSVFHWLFD